MKLDFVEAGEEDLIISWDDVVEERRYWQCAPIGYVLGEKVHYAVMVNFVRSQWKKIAMPEILLHDKGYCIFRFADKHDLEVVSNSTWFLSSRPLVLRSKEPQFQYDEAMLDSIPTCVQFSGLDMQY
ncbi:hypothetical protein Droror1_Dr00023052 [Drosera rotundifolia]